MADNNKDESLAGTFVKCAGQSVVESMAYPLDALTGVIGNLTGSDSKALSGSFFGGSAAEKYQDLVGLDPKSLTKKESFACQAGEITGTIASLAVPGAAAFKAVKAADTLGKAEKAINTVGKTTMAADAVNFGFDLKKMF
jgi:hypothetical protein